MVASSIALFTGNNENSLSLFIEKIGQFHNQEDVINGDFEFGQYKYFYYAGMVILAVGGIYYQHVSKSKSQEEIENSNVDDSYFNATIVVKK